MRIVSDFDGVLTDPEAEAEAVGDFQVSVVSAAIGDSRRAMEIIQSMRRTVKATPERHGWLVEGVISCYADEDPYIFHNAVGAALWAQGPRDVIDALREAGHEDQASFCDRSFRSGTELWRSKNSSHVNPDAARALRVLDERGVEVVVVSNSSTDRVKSILGEHASGTLLRLRGGARKFVVTKDRPVSVPEQIVAEGRAIPVRRGYYFDILDEERPDVVIGDVLSLDLALPLVLRDTAKGFGGMKLYLKRSAGTPEWAVRVAKDNGIRVIDKVAEVVDLLLGSTR
ncbi:MAG: HAD family hydrolase [Deltaproteobacteria bacterium]|nr:HAD family hydrolase [Deltaproteobacteria bacterium]